MYLTGRWAIRPLDHQGPGMGPGPSDVWCSLDRSAACCTPPLHRTGTAYDTALDLALGALYPAYSESARVCSPRYRKLSELAALLQLVLLECSTEALNKRLLLGH